jgi:hypothetical protein
MTAEAQRNRERAELEERVSVRRALLEQKVFILDMRFLSFKNLIINFFFARWKKKRASSYESDQIAFDFCMKTKPKN